MTETFQTEVGGFYGLMSRGPFSHNLTMVIGYSLLQTAAAIDIISYYRIFKVIYLALIDLLQWVNNVTVNNVKSIVSQNQGFQYEFWHIFCYYYSILL